MNDLDEGTRERIPQRKTGGTGLAGDPEEKIRERAARESERANLEQPESKSGIPDPHAPPVYLEAFRVMKLKV